MKKIELISKIVEYIALIVGVVLVVASFTNTAADAVVDGSATDMAIVWTCILLGLGIVLAVASECISAASDTKSLIKAVVAVVAAVVVIGIFWALSDDTPLNLIGYEGTQNEGNWLKVADTSLFTLYLCLGGAIVTIAVTEIYQLFK